VSPGLDVAHAEAPEGLPLSQRGPAPTRVVAAFGFWLFLLSDIIVFAALFAAYAVLAASTNGGPSGAELFDKRHVLYETACLLASSFTCGMIVIATDSRSTRLAYLWSLITAGLGAMFVGLELSEFANLVHGGNGPTRSAFLSAFFALVGTHGIHVTVGIGWLGMMVGQVATIGFAPKVIRRLFCFSLFWHALDIVWIGIFTVVYLGVYR
jgi:cytochrome o ubiquinol oxidase subunit III